MNKDNKFQAYYTKSEPILNYMAGQVQLNPGSVVLEPCGGDGVFVDKVKERCPSVQVDIYELNPEAANGLRKKYHSDSSISVIEADTLLADAIVSHKKQYDSIIGNPPYGARDDENKKSLLASLYPDLYVKESYTLFLYACLNNLKEGGKLCFIIPDTFLFLHRHKAVREFILQNSVVEEILLFPSSFFPGVSFGYSNLSIITLCKISSITECFRNNITIKNCFKTVGDIESAHCAPSFILNQGDVFHAVDSTFLLSQDEHILSLINDSSIPRIGDIAACVTGFYSGCDKDFLHPINKEIKNAKKYVTADPNRIVTRQLSPTERLNGLSGKVNLVPLVKGGNRQYYKPTEWYMDWSQESVRFYKTNKASRFQNSSYYFRGAGIAIPMIRSRKLTAALIEERLIDQSIVGIFLNDPQYEKYLLGFFNSVVCTRIINVINPSTNNSANYIKKIPFIRPTEEVLSSVNDLVDLILSKKRNGNEDTNKEEKELDVIFSSVYQL